MSIEPAKAAELLSGLYVERQDGQWKTVASCLEELMAGTVTSLADLASVAFNLAEDKSPVHNKLISRAQKLNNRAGQAGHLEVQELAKASIQLAISGDGHDKLAAHVSRIGFNRELEQNLADITQAAAKKTRAAIRKYTREQMEFEKLTDPIVVGKLQSTLKQRDDYYHVELWRREESHAITLACMVGQVSPWEAIQQILGYHNFPYPYEFELITVQACLASITDDEHVNLTKMPELLANLQTNDKINLPVLSCISDLQNGRSTPAHIKNISLPMTDFAQQLLLEIIFLRQRATS